MELKDVLESKVYLKENSAVSFMSPSTYIQPFLDVVKDRELHVNVSDSVINANDDNTQNIAYARVNIEAILDSPIPGFQSRVGMIYALDIQKPMVRIYSGQRAVACMNLTIFNSEKVFTQDLLGNYADAYRKAEEYVEQKQKEIEEFTATYNELTQTLLDREQLNEELGRLLRVASRTRVGTTPIVGAAKLVDDSSSAYYVKAGDTCSRWNLFNAITQNFSNREEKEVMDTPIKVVQLSKLFNLN